MLASLRPARGAVASVLRARVIPRRPLAEPLSRPFVSTRRWLSTPAEPAPAAPGGAGADAIVITERCAARIVDLNRAKGADEPTAHRLLRLSVEPGGCSGFQYRFELQDADQVDVDEDAVFEKGGAKVVVDEGSLALLEGATVDFEDDMMKSAFVVAANPQSSASCGCGTSFQVEI
jgi:iron-sulfur cluster assembly accessory protein